MSRHGRFWAGFGPLAAWLKAKSERRVLTRLALYLLLTRLIVGLVAYYAVRSRASVSVNPLAQTYLGDNPLLNGWLRWDVWWYISIVERGYEFHPNRASNVAFLPGFPVLIELVTPVFGSPVVAGLVVANLASAAAAFALFAWVRERAGLLAGERAVVWLLVYPFSFFFYTVYAEGLFLLVCTLALLEADRGRWLTASLWATAATMTRPMGILLVPAFAWAILGAWRAGQKPRAQAVAVLLPAAALAGYAVYLWVRYGDPFAVYAAHESAWKIGPRLDPIAHLRDAYSAISSLRPFYMQIFAAVQLLLPIAFIPLCVLAWRRLGAASGVYAALAWLIAMLFGADSAGREFLAVVPAFAVLGSMRWQWGFSVILGVGSFALLLLFVFAFAAGQFVG